MTIRAMLGAEPSCHSLKNQSTDFASAFADRPAKAAHSYSKHVSYGSRKWGGLHVLSVPRRALSRRDLFEIMNHGRTSLPALGGTGHAAARKRATRPSSW